MSLLVNLPLTQIKIQIAKILYFWVTLFTGKQRRIIERNGITYEVDIQEGLDLSLYLFGNFQKHVSENKLISLPNDATILDVGANFGLMTLNYATLYPEGKVYSFEPTHYALEKLKRNIELNPNLADRITVTNSFISNEVNEKPDIKAYSSWKVDGSKEVDKHDIHGGTAKPADGVGSITLDAFCKEHNIDKIDFIKIDTDGHELQILTGSKEVINRHKPSIIFEIGMYLLDEQNIPFSAYADFFESINCTMYHSLNGAVITGENYANHVPQRGTIDIIAIPKVS
ncbi:MAG: FkbM family methyltransferase [Flavobacteriales bacterium]|nr:FkbM family methyltransferase [Flavobacteriales bacterium]